MLAMAYIDGNGVPRDRQSAYFWMLHASINGDQLFISLRDALERSLTVDERSNAQAAARNWKPKSSMH
ncbi:MAG: hypothetical protein CFE38_02745 [Comamonadaceae bacterium PBBC1]|nr:MAG: hypothetical protein CFE38_02745 [Comamonadaceae bacterium PBBC1]